MFDTAQLSTEEKNDFVFRTLSEKSNRTEDVVASLIEKAIVAPNPITEMGSPWCSGRSRHATSDEINAFRDMCRKMACKFLWILNRSRSQWVPTQSCVDLTTTGAALTNDEVAMSVDEVREMWATEPVKVRKPRRVRRHFQKCKYEPCGKRFLAARQGQEFCAGYRCSRRYARLHPSNKAEAVIEPVTTP